MSQYITPPDSYNIALPLNVQKTRVDYVDLLKGITILWIIWIHTDAPDFGNFRNPIFFYASGIFFKLTDAKSFFSKRMLMIIIPFIFFYIASIPFRIIIDLWDFRTIQAFDWSRIIDLFKVIDRSDYLSLNVPLWFLLTLFMIQTFSFIIFRLPNFIIFICATASLIFFKELSQIPTPFMINNASAWFGFFAFGYLTGKPLIKFMDSITRKTCVFLGSSLILTSCILIEHYEISDWHGLVEKTKLMAFILSFMTFFSFFDGSKKLEILRFFGKNSLIVLGAHLWILVPIERIMYRLTRLHDPAIGLGMAIATAIILIPIIRWMNQYIPFLVGKHQS